MCGFFRSFIYPLCCHRDNEFERGKGEEKNEKEEMVRRKEKEVKE